MHELLQVLKKLLLLAQSFSFFVRCLITLGASVLLALVLEHAILLIEQLVHLVDQLEIGIGLNIHNHIGVGRRGLLGCRRPLFA